MLVHCMVVNKLNENQLYPFSHVVRRTSSSSTGTRGTGDAHRTVGGAATIKSLGTIVSGDERATVMQAQQFGLWGPFDFYL